MMVSKKRIDAVRALLPERWQQAVAAAEAFAPVNIALVKYWGKRDEELHLPVTDSFSCSLPLGTTTRVTVSSSLGDEVWYNGALVDHSSPFFERVVEFLSLVRPEPACMFRIDTKNLVPTAAGLASSASGFAALVLALNNFFGWKLPYSSLSILARLGSGSACRSILPGFMHWKRGIAQDGSDSFAHPFLDTWQDLFLGIAYVDICTKEVSSRYAMKHSQETSPFYPLWSSVVEKSLSDVIGSIHRKEFLSFGQAVEHNAIAMHSTMLTSIPQVCFFKEETIRIMHTVWKARKEGLPLFFTMDAGPNVKILFLKKNETEVRRLFPSIAIMSLF